MELRRCVFRRALSDDRYDDGLPELATIPIHTLVLQSLRSSYALLLDTIVVKLA